MTKKKVTQLEELHVREVSLVRKGANGEVFDIIKADDSQTPSDILKSLMKDPETMDEVDKQTFEDMDKDTEAYGQYVDEFVDQFVSDLKKDGVDPDEFISEMIADKTGSTKDSGEGDSKEDNSGDSKGKTVKKSDESKVEKSLAEKVSDIVKSILGKKEETSVEKGMLQEQPYTDSYSNRTREQKLACCCEDMLCECLYAIQTATRYGANGELTDTVKKLLSIVNELNDTCAEVQKSDSTEGIVFDTEKINAKLSEFIGVQKGEDEMKAEDVAKAVAEAIKPLSDTVTSLSERVGKVEKGEKTEEVAKSETEVLTEAITKALEPVKQAVDAVSDRVNSIEKQERPSGKLEGTDVQKSGEEKPQGFWKSVQINR